MPRAVALTAAQAARVVELLPYAERAAKALAQPMRLRHLDYEDLRGAAYLGLVHAVLRFDASRGVTFSTLSYSVIAGFVLDAVRAALRQNGWSRARQLTGRPQLTMRVEWPSHRTADGDVMRWEPATPTPNYVEVLARRAAIAAIPRRRDRYALRRRLAGSLQTEIAPDLGVNASRSAQITRRAVAAARKAYQGGR